ncbi:50S ribosomal protein L29 [Blattabacterium cuenoti]|uniref:50S ribosomal protein L29 n=1 Tax=Blattabacterium cuenoti TaxID=1653831 RepID=UPI00163C52CC|nr:50S ribosomal protein L29 [Blattabacterium cuenoti]
MNTLDIEKDSSVHDLIRKIDEKQKNYQNMIFNHHIKILKNPIKIRFVRRDIAKLKTEYNKKINDKRK